MQINRIHCTVALALVAQVAGALDMRSPVPPLYQLKLPSEPPSQRYLYGMPAVQNTTAGRLTWLGGDSHSAYTRFGGGITISKVNKVGDAFSFSGREVDYSQRIALSSRTGEFVIDFEFYQVGDQIEVFANGKMIADTGFRSGQDRMIVRYDPAATASLDVVVNRGRKLQRETLWNFTCYEATIKDYRYFQGRKNAELRGEGFVDGAVDDIDGELWKTDGTESGTRIVADINPGPVSSWPEFHGMHRGKILLSAATGGGSAGPHKWQLYSLDPQSDTLVALTEITVGRWGSFSKRGEFVELKSGCMFMRAEVALLGKLPECWVTDGTPGGTRRLETAKTAEGDPDYSMVGPYYVYQGYIYYYKEFAGKETPDRLELWRSDGSQGGTEKLISIPDTRFVFGERHFSAIGRHVYFNWRMRNDPTKGDSDFGLWRYDSEDGSCLPFKIFNTPVTGISHMGVIGERFIFEAPADPEDISKGQAIWSSDGTTEGTSIIANLNVERLEDTGLYFSGPNPGRIGADRSYPMVNGKMLVMCWSYDGNHALMATDGTKEGTYPVIDLEDFPEEWNTGALERVFFSTFIPSANPGTSDEAWVFSVQNRKTKQSQHWITDGTVEGTFPMSQLIKGVTASTGFEGGFALNGRQYLYASGLIQTARGFGDSQLVEVNVKDRSAFGICTPEVAAAAVNGSKLNWSVDFPFVLNNRLLIPAQVLPQADASDGADYPKGAFRLYRYGNLPGAPSDESKYSSLSASFIGNITSGDRQGQLTINVNKGKVSGLLLIGGKTAAILGKLDNDGKLAVTLPSWAGLALQASVAGSSGNESITAQIDGGAQALLRMVDSTGKGKDSFSMKGWQFNQVMMNSDSLLGGFASASANGSGVLRFAGRLGDGRPFTASARAVRDPQGGSLILPVLTRLGKNAGEIWGDLLLTQDLADGRHLSGQMMVRRTSDGQVEDFEVHGRRWEPKSKVNLISGSADRAGTTPVEVWIGARDGIQALWPYANQVVNKAAGLKLTAKGGDGSFSGSLKGAGKFSGALFAEDIELPGYTESVRGVGVMPTAAGAEPVWILSR